MLYSFDSTVRVSLATIFLNRVPEPEGGILSFARPKESIQRKGRPDTAYFLRAAVVIAGCQMGLSTHGILAVPLRAIPDNNVSARRGIRDLVIYPVKNISA